LFTAQSLSEHLQLEASSIRPSCSVSHLQSVIFSSSSNSSNSARLVLSERPSIAVSVSLSLSVAGSAVLCYFITGLCPSHKSALSAPSFSCAKPAVALCSSGHKIPGTGPTLATQTPSPLLSGLLQAQVTCLPLLPTQAGCPSKSILLSAPLLSRPATLVSSLLIALSPPHRQAYILKIRQQPLKGKVLGKDKGILDCTVPAISLPTCQSADPLTRPQASRPAARRPALHPRPRGSSTVSRNC